MAGRLAQICTLSPALSHKVMGEGAGSGSPITCDRRFSHSTVQNSLPKIFTPSPGWERVLELVVRRIVLLDE
jgi:hypothetical protein